MMDLEEQARLNDQEPQPQSPRIRRTRRFALLAVVISVALLAPMLFVVARQILTTPDGAGGGARPGATRASGVALSSPVDPDATFYWELDEEPRSLIPLEDIISGGPSPDGIPPIDQPSFVPVSEADAWLADAEPVIAFEHDGVVRAYPIQILMWHEIVNDVVGGLPVTVSYCPLCNSAIVYDRRVGDKVLDFGTSGRLYFSDLVMYDRQTKSLWPQIEGRAVVGPLIGEELTTVPSAFVSWEEFKASHPNADVLSRDTGFGRPYGENPYVGYDRAGSSPFLFRGDTDDRLDLTERVLALDLGGETKAYPFTLLAEGSPRALHDTVGGIDVVIFFSKGTASALDQHLIADGRDVGSTGVFAPRTAGGERLAFIVREGRFIDRQTGSTWTLLGEAIAGPLRGEHLEPLNHLNTFWFAWAAFEPDTIIWTDRG